MTRNRGLLSPDTIHDAPRVLMVTAPNPGPKTLGGTHTFVVGRESAYVIDPGPSLADYQHGLDQWLRADGATVRAVLLTHSHPDHAPGAAILSDLLGAPVFASATMPLDIARSLDAEARLEDGELLPLDGAALRVVATPGHAPEHIAFWLEDARLLFAGDTILGEGTTLIAPPEGNMQQYMQTLERIRDLRPRLIAPGHGPLVTNPQATIDEYVRHRREREQQVLQVLEAGPATVADLVRRIYTDADPGLYALAAGSVEAQLEKLTAEGKVQGRDGAYTLAATPQ